MSISREERKGMKRHTTGIIYVARNVPVGSPETFFRMIFKKNPALPVIADQVCRFIRKNGGIEARRYWYKKLSHDLQCTETNLKTVLYKLVAIGLLNREEGRFTFSNVFERRLEEMSTVIRDVKNRPA